MRIVYQSTNLADVHLLRDLLVQTDILAQIQGEFLRGGIGELPADTPVSLAVPDEQAEAARAIVLDWERARPEDDAEEDPEAAVAPVAAPPRRGVSALQVLGALVFGALCGGAIVWAIYNHPANGPLRDFDGDGRVDERVILAGGRVDRIESDRNRDGRIDHVVHYGPDRTIDGAEYDDDFDGRLEGRTRYDDNLPVEWTVDLDGDGVVELRATYERGVVAKEETFDRNARIVRIIRYRGGVPASGEFDSDGDGVLDTARTYDASGEIVASKPLASGKGA